MRTIVNISLPQNLTTVVKQAVSGGKYASKSEFFRHLLRMWMTSYELEKSRRELKQGKGKLLRSLKSLR